MKERAIAARDAFFKVQSSDPEKPSLAAQGVSLDFNLETNLADIKSEQDGRSVLDFPFTQVRTSIGEARWDLEKKIISLEGARKIRQVNGMKGGRGIHFIIILYYIFSGI